MIDMIPTMAENITTMTASYPSDAIITSWGMVNQLIVVILALGIFIGWGIGYHCYRLGIRFPWHRDD